MAPKLDRKGRAAIADKLMVWANLVFAGLVVSQAFANRFDGSVAFAGVVMFSGAYLLAYVLMRGGEQPCRH